MWDTQQVQCLSAPPKDSCVPSSSAVFSYYTPPLSPFKVGPHGLKVHSIRRFDWAAPPLHRVWETLGKDEEENAMILARALEPSIAFTSSTTSWFERVNFPQKVEVLLITSAHIVFQILGDCHIPGRTEASFDCSIPRYRQRDSVWLPPQVA